MKRKVGRVGSNVKPIPAAKVFAKARHSAAYRTAFDALDAEFTLIESLLKARAAAGLTQAQVADRMDTSQGNVARLETGRVAPSIRTLERYAHATGHRLKIMLEPLPS